jgi:hypothetical protein
VSAVGAIIRGMSSETTATTSDLRADAQRLLRHLIDANEPHQMPQFQFGQASDIDGLDGRAAHEAMRTAAHLGWVEARYASSATHLLCDNRSM